MNQDRMTRASDLFSNWARTGKSDSMAENHAFSVNEMLTHLPETEFDFLDIGCGNGWVCRKVAQMTRCRSVTGIDVAGDMISLARQRKTSDRETYICGDILTADLPGKLDVIFAMESLYYFSDLTKGIASLASRLKPGGRLIFGCDYHRNNPQTEKWSETLGVPMHYLSEEAWQQVFKDAGLRIESSGFVRDPENPEGWHRDEKGTLIIVAGHTP